MMMMCGDITPCLCECVLMAAGAAHSRQLQCVSSLHKAGRGEREEELNQPKLINT